MSKSRQKNSASGLLRAMVAAGRALATELHERRGDREFSDAAESLAAELGREVPAEEAADVLAQAVICAESILTDASGRAFAAVEPLHETMSVWEQWVLAHIRGRVLSTKHSVLNSPQMNSPQLNSLRRSSKSSAASASLSTIDRRHLYDQFLQLYAPPARKHHGVYFTPRPIADYVVRQVDIALRRDFGLTDGLACQSAIRNSQSAIQILDPACGSGVFLLAVIDHLHTRLGNDWNEFVPDLLARLVGIELLPVPALLAKLNVALELAETGYDFHGGCQIRIQIGDALSPARQSAIRNTQSAIPIPILIGNPPFGSLSTNTNSWIATLVRGNGEVRGYVQAGDLRLGERKTWLYDDYVKFIRLAQWHVVGAGRGIVAFVTNHGYLDNATFRLMRQELARAFPRIDIVDLHGNRKKGETAPGGGSDENVFGLDQGVAIGVFSRPPEAVHPGGLCAAGIHYAELWGSRDAKLARLADPQPLTGERLSPNPPHYRFVPQSAPAHPEYAAGWPIDEVMPVHTTAPVTARDHFVVAFTREELIERINEFRDLLISDDAIRAKYFHRTRSWRYPRGDTRGWKLAEARRKVAADDRWPEHIIRCAYRPFDWRFVFWHPAMIDWPRNEVTRHLTTIQKPKAKIQNMCLIARRQQLPTQPCTFFWISDCVALDGIIRSDNRGSESLFPMWLVAGEDADRSAGSPVANIAPRFVDLISDRLGSQPEPQAILGYVYALFNSSTYRERYASHLRCDFPRVLLPLTSTLFDSLAKIGQRLIELHLRRDDQGVGSRWRTTTIHDYLSFAANDSRPPDCQPAWERPIEEFRVGGYLILSKWLQPKHRSRQDPEYAQIAAALADSIDLIAQIDRCIESHGAFPAAFARGGRKSLAGNGKRDG